MEVTKGGSSMAGEQVLISTVFVAGVLSFIAPCILPLLPVYLSVFSTNAERAGGREFRVGKVSINPTLLVKTIVFVSGLSMSFVLLGFGAGALGILLSSNWFMVVCGGIAILLGLYQIGLFNFAFLNRESKMQLKRSEKRDIFGTFLLGFTFSFGWTPCIGPALGAVLGLSASEGQATYGAFLMFVYASGLLIPFLLLAVFSDTVMRHVKKIQKHMRKIQVAGGVLVILMTFCS